MKELMARQASGYHKLRRLKDQCATALISAGGVGVIAAVLLIFLYLLYEVLPLFKGADLEHYASYSFAGHAEVLHVAVEEQGEIAARVQRDGQIVFSALRSGQDIHAEALGATGAAVTAFAAESDASRSFALGFDNGAVVIAEHSYQRRFQDNAAHTVSQVEQPLGAPRLSQQGQAAVAQLALRRGVEQSTLAVLSDNGALEVLRFQRQQALLGAQQSYTQAAFMLPPLDYAVRRMLLSPEQQHLFVLGADSELRIYDLTLAQANVSDSLQQQLALAPGREVVDIKFLLGGVSLLVADDEGRITQWFWQPVAGRFELLQARAFETSVLGAQLIATEHRRKGFAVISGANTLSLLHATADARVYQDELSQLQQAPSHIALAPRADYLLLLAPERQVHVFAVDNAHPEASFQALWRKVWYETYAEPERVWQSSASSNDYEPKYSLAPLAFGTLKAAFYSMLLAAPLAIAGAVYTAFFMAPALRRKIKPTIELMEALPTVILGFLAGLWLAPFVERHLPAVFALFLLMPLAVLIAAYAWTRLPARIRHAVPDGWQPLLLVPVICLLGWASVSASQGVELLLFGGDARLWLSTELGVSYDQRNALIVGIAMGFAVVPTIFSIAEDAIFSVPAHLPAGSLALGATPWQTLVQVVMPTASPGIFSALMIGMGRAVGETMIVLMATGNTPLMDINIFEGMRTLAANIAVEVPEAEVASTHYHILFLAAFVLFLFTFFVNTLAELVRQRLRERYGSL